MHTRAGADHARTNSNKNTQTCARSPPTCLLRAGVAWHARMRMRARTHAGRHHARSHRLTARMRAHKHAHVDRRTYATLAETQTNTYRDSRARLPTHACCAHAWRDNAEHGVARRDMTLSALRHQRTAHTQTQTRAWNPDRLQLRLGQLCVSRTGYIARQEPPLSCLMVSSEKKSCPHPPRLRKSSVSRPPCHPQ